MSRKKEELKDILPIADDEIFKEIDGYNHYRVSNYGRVFSDNKELRPHITKNGYYTVCITSNNGAHVTCRIHRLVFAIFNSYSYDEFKNVTLTVDHIDGDKTNNRLSNLQLLTRGENTSKAWKQNVHEKKKRAVNQYDLNGSYIKTFSSTSEAARALGKPSYFGPAIATYCRTARMSDRNHQLYGYQWRFYNGDTSDIGVATSAAPIRTYLDQYTTDGVFVKRWEGYDAACAGVGLKSVQSLYRIFSGKAKSAGGYLWRRVEIPASEYV